MALPSHVVQGSPHPKIEALLCTIGNYLDEIAGMQAVICLRPESAPPTDTDAIRETLVRLQTKLLNILAKNKTHLMDPIHDEVLFQVRRLESDTVGKLRSHVQWLIRTEEEELNKQRWRTRANVTLQESTVDLPRSTAARQLQQEQGQPRKERGRPVLSRLIIPGSASSSPDPRRNNRHPNHQQPSQTTHAIAHNGEAASRRTVVQDSKPNTGLILIGWLQGEPPAGSRALASVYDPTEISMPAMPPMDMGFDPSRPLRPPSWGDVPVCI